MAPRSAAWTVTIWDSNLRLASQIRLSQSTLKFVTRILNLGKFIFNDSRKELESCWRKEEINKKKMKFVRAILVASAQSRLMINSEFIKINKLLNNLLIKSFNYQLLIRPSDFSLFWLAQKFLTHFDWTKNQDIFKWTNQTTETVLSKSKIPNPTQTSPQIDFSVRIVNRVTLAAQISSSTIFWTDKERSSEQSTKMRG